MTDRICLCVGVSKYANKNLQELPGAFVDAKSVFRALIDPSIGAYDETKSRLLLDANKGEVTSVLAEILYRNKIDTFTFFFAGHGGSKNESYALCCADTELERYGLSALAIGEVFRLVNDARPSHSNIIIDACNAAGVLSDFGDLLKPSVLGPASSSSVSILAMSATDRFAQETESGGLGTATLLRCLSGEIEASVRKEYLSLEDVGIAIAPMLEEQVPTTWSFAISGASKFAKNPSFGDESSKTSVEMPAFGSSMTSLISKPNVELLWKEYILLSEEPDMRRMQECLQHVMQEFEDANDQANLLLGLFESFSARAALSKDAFAIVEVQATMIFSAALVSAAAVMNELRSYLLSQLDQSLSIAVQHFVGCISEEYGLVSKNATYSEFFALPIRISKVAAWSLCSVYFADNEEIRSKRIRIAETVLDGLKQNYETSFLLVSEEQAAFIHVISSLAAKYGLSAWSEEYISTLYFDFFFYKKHVAKTKLDATDVFDFLRYRIERGSLDYQRFNAKPTQLLFILLYHFVLSNQKDIIRYDFADLDKTDISTFVPKSYINFSEEMIIDGKNISFEIGFDIFSVDQFEHFVNTSILPPVNRAAEGLSDQDFKIALMSSMIYPDRIAWFLNQILTSINE